MTSKTRRNKKTVASLLIAVLAITLLSCSQGNSQQEETTAGEETVEKETVQEETAETTETTVLKEPFDLKNPEITYDRSIDDDSDIVTWDCVWFGSYPQGEVITTDMDSSEKYNGLKCTGMQEGDLVVDDDVYEALSGAADEEWDANGDITLNGEKYRRVKKEDNIDSKEQYYDYSWETWYDGGDKDSVNRGKIWYDSLYHYFKYQPIKWRILSTDGTQAFLLADKALDYQSYHEMQEEVTWETSTIRSWLNGYDGTANAQNVDYSNNNFLNTAFTSEEKNAIEDTDVKNDGSDLGTQYDRDRIQYEGVLDGGNNTVDKLFFLSWVQAAGMESATYGFSRDDYGYRYEDALLHAKCSTYTKALGAWWSYENFFDVGNCEWMLRSPGDKATEIQVVSSEGGFDIWEDYFVESRYAVRPALYLDLKKASKIPVEAYSYAGTVSSHDDLNPLFTEGENRYRVLDSIDTEAAYIGSTEDTIEEVTIPDEIQAGSWTVPITTIDEYVFANSSLKKITIGENVDRIGEEAFEDCKELSEIIIKSKKLKHVEYNAFVGLKKDVKITVPEEKLSDYQKLFKKKGLKKAIWNVE